MKTEMPEIDELLTPLFVQARQEALKEANKIPLNRSGIVTSTPTKVAHLVKEAEIAITELTLKQVLDLIGEDEEVPRPVDDESRARFYRRSGQNFLKSQLRQSAERIWGDK